MTTCKLIHGDCIVEMQKLAQDNTKVDMILTDLPYGTTRCKWDNVIPFDVMWSCIHKLTYEDSPIVLFGNEPFSSRLRLSNLDEYKYDWVWDKSVRTGFLNAKKMPLKQYEHIHVFYKKQCKYNPIMWEGKEESHPHKTTKKTNYIYGKHNNVNPVLTKMKYPTNIIKVNARTNECNNTKRVHPTQKPIELLEYLIQTYTDTDDTVLDFTMGSGSCGVACQNTERNFIGIELDHDYYSIAEQRINQTRLI